MKKTIMFTAFLIILLLPACSVNTRGPLPYGIWQSENPNITLYFYPESEVFYGTYLKEGVEIDTIIAFANAYKQFDIYDVNVDFSVTNVDDSAYFVGDYKVRGNRMTYNIKPRWRERTGIDQIIFEKIEDIEVQE